MQIEQIKVISLKRLVGAAKAPEKAGEVNWLCAVYGVCVGVKEGVKDTGPFVRFDGDFIARTLIPVGRDKEIRAVRGGELFLPPAAEDLLLADDVGADGTFTEFGVKIGIGADDKGKPQYVAEYLVKPTQASPAETLVKTHAPEWFGAPQTPAAASGKKK